MLETGSKAPPFTLDGSDRKKHSLSDYLGKNVVLYFYPKDDTPGCTTEAQDFRNAIGSFEKLNTVVLGVSKDSIDSHCQFRDKYELNFTLLSDPELDTHKAYGAWGEKNMYGKKSMGVIRSTVIIDSKGNIAKHYAKVRVPGHVDAVLKDLQSLTS